MRQSNFNKYRPKATLCRVVPPILARYPSLITEMSYKGKVQKSKNFALDYRVQLQKLTSALRIAQARDDEYEL